MQLKYSIIHFTQQVESTQYDIKVFTGNEPKSGTDSNVFLTIYGEKGETHENALTQSSTHYDNFERGQVTLLKYSLTRKYFYY